MNLARALVKAGKNVLWAMKRNAPGLLTGCAVAGSIASTVGAVKGTINAVKIVEEKKEELEVDHLPFWTIVKLTWRCYVPTFIFLFLATFCGITSCTEAGRRNAALLTAYNSSASLLESTREAEREVVGKTKADEIDARAQLKEIAKNNEQITVVGVYPTKYGNTLIKDEFTGVYFRSDINVVERQIKEYSNSVKVHGCLDIGCLYTRFNVPIDDCYVCKNYGWNESMPDFDDNIRIGSGLHPYTREPMAILYYSHWPTYVYDMDEHSPYRYE